MQFTVANTQKHIKTSDKSKLVLQINFYADIITSVIHMRKIC